MIEWHSVRYLFKYWWWKFEGGRISSTVVLCFWNLLWLARSECSVQSGSRGTAAIITLKKKYVVTYRLQLSGFSHLIVLQFILMFRRNMPLQSSRLKELLPSWCWADYGEYVFCCWQDARNEASQSLKTTLAKKHFEEFLPWKSEKWYIIVC